MNNLLLKLINATGRMALMLVVVVVTSISIAIMFLTMMPKPTAAELATFSGWEKSQTAQQAAQESRVVPQSGTVTP